MNAHFVQRSCCPVCDSASFHDVCNIPFLDTRVHDFLTSYYENRIDAAILEESAYQVVRCLRCELLFQLNILNDANMIRLYEEWISQLHSRQKKEQGGIGIFAEYADTARAIQAVVGKRPDLTSVLDFGMGWGYWARMAQSFNYRVTGLELSSARRAYAQKMAVHAVSSLEPIDDDHFDYVYSCNVFEHLPNPRDVLCDLVRVVKPGGWIHIDVPYRPRMLDRLLAPDWTARADPLHPLEHINCFSRLSLRILAERAGLMLQEGAMQPEYITIRNPLLRRWAMLRRRASPNNVFMRKAGG